MEPQGGGEDDSEEDMEPQGGGEDDSEEDMEPQGGGEDDSEEDMDPQGGDDISPDQFIKAGILPLVKFYTEQVRQVLPKSESQEEMLTVLKPLTDESGAALALCEDVIKNSSPEFEAALVAYLKNGRNSKELRRALFEYRRAKTILRDNADYYGSDKVKELCNQYEQKLAPIVEYIHLFRFGKQQGDEKLVEYMVAYQDREMVLHDLRHALKDLIDKKINHQKARITMESYDTTFHDISLFIEAGEKNNKEFARKAYDESRSEKWTKKQIRQMKKYIKQVKKLKNTEVDEYGDLAEPYEIAEAVIERVEG